VQAALAQTRHRNAGAHGLVSVFATRPNVHLNHADEGGDSPEARQLRNIIFGRKGKSQPSCSDACGFHIRVFPADSAPQVKAKLQKKW